MTTDELNATLENLVDLMSYENIPTNIMSSIYQAAEAVADQLRYRATGSILAAKERV